MPARTSPNSEPLVLAFNKVPPRSTYTLPQIPLTFQRRPTPPAPLPSSSSFPSGEISPSEEETTGRESTEGKVGSEEPPFAEDVAHQEAAPERPAAQELTPSQMPSPPLDVSAANRPAASKVPVSEEVPEPVIPPSSTGEKNEESTPPAGADAVSMGAGPREPSPKIHSTPATPEEETGGEPETSDAPVIIPVQKAPRIPLPRPQTDEDLPPDAVTISLGGGTLQSLIGRVTVNGEEAIPGRVLGIGDKIRTERASNATLAIGGAVIEVQPFTRLEILQTEVHSRRNHPLEEYTTLFLERGSLDVVLRRIEGSFTIKTPTKTFTRQSGAFTITQPAKGEPRLVSRY
ncbi:MAG: hypothetical protein D6679_10580 [Candidatus Hydrogenedentota bacterium]|nr:MAG: hypothetical protein D6679_10580 [Candidatus Hydrogenedentota bacterium]